MEWKLWRKTDRKRFQNFNTGISTIRAATEYAKIRIAQLHGHTLRDRAKQLIAIAAPERHDYFMQVPGVNAVISNYHEFDRSLLERSVKE